MRKSLKLFTLAFALLFAAVINVNAAEVSVDTESKLKECVNTSGNVCKLGSNIVLTNALEIATDATINLNGYSITPDTAFPTDSLIIVLHGGTLTVDDSKGTGKISTGTLDKDVFVGIKMTKAGGDDSKKAVLNVKAGTIEGYSYGISGNGNPGRGNSVVNITGGTVKGLSLTGAGIFNPQEGEVTITGGKISGATGIEMRSGTLMVTGGTIEATASFSVNPNGNGTTTTGVGIAVSQHTTAKVVQVGIVDGTVKGEKSVYQANVQNNSEESVKKIELAIIGGTFEGKVESENVEEFIAGGTYNTAIEEEYIYSKSKTENDNGSLVIKTPWEIIVEAGANGTVTAPETAYEGEKVTLNIKPNEGYKVASIEVINIFNEKVEVKDNSFEMENSAVKVTVTFEKEEVKEEPKDEEKEESKEEPKEESKGEVKVPETGDSVVTFLVIGLMSLLTLGYAVNKLRKNA